MDNCKTCEGDCINTHGEHGGEVRAYKVQGKDVHDWGLFYYCDNAVEEDRRHGFVCNQWVDKDDQK